MSSTVTCSLFGLGQVIHFSVPRSGGTEAGHEVRGTNKLACQKLKILPRDFVAVNSRLLQKMYNSGSITVSALGSYPDPVLLQLLCQAVPLQLGGCHAPSRLSIQLLFQIVLNLVLSL